MIREIYFRDPSDPRYAYNKIETSDKLEAVLNKIRMILYTNRGECLGEPTLGLDLDTFLFDIKINEQSLRERFYAQIAKFIPEREFKIDLDVQYDDDGVKKQMYLFVNVNDNRMIGLAI